MTSTRTILTGDGDADWYAIELQRIRDQPERLGATGGIATEWGSAVATSKESQLAAALTVARSFARLLGVSQATEIRLARDTEQGTAVAGFYDAPDSFERPFILLDEAAVLRIQDPSDQLDTAIGMALHEAAHVLWSRKIFSRMSDDTRDPRLRSLENLLEDWRIEERVIAEAPGWARYLYKTRKVLLADCWLREASGHWEKMVDTDKIGFLIGCFVRTPQLFECHPCWKAWTDLLGRNIFGELRKRLPLPPRSEEDVAELADRLLDLVADYWNRAFDALKDRGNVSAAEMERLRAQHVADESDRRLEKRRQNKRRPFSLEEFLDALERDGCVRAGSSSDVILEVVRASQSSRGEQPGSTWRGTAARELPEQWLPEQDRGSVVLENDVVTPGGREAYESARQRVAPLIARLRHVFHRPDNTRSRRNGVSTGQLDSRRLWRAPFDDTLFSRPRIESADPKSLVALLLDASGSMGEGERYQRGLETAVLLNESLAQSSCQTEIFSHSTEDDCRCVLYYHGTAGPQAAASIGSYQPRECNFDYQAIRAVAATLREEAREASAAYLICVNDGLPCTPDHRAGTGVQATHEAVVAVRRQGWKVISIGFADAYCEQIYGDDWSIRLDDEQQLPHNFANLLIRMLR